MPLLKGVENVGKNIEELTAANAGREVPRPHRQIVAIALHTAMPRKGHLGDRAPHVGGHHPHVGIRIKM